MLEVKPEKRIDLNGVVSHSWFVEMSKSTIYVVYLSKRN
jgi:hypothetical protein